MDKKKDFALDMEARSNQRTENADVWTQLQQKEADILLAAELGKALLEKNEELVKQQEKLIEEYNAKLEVGFRFLFQLIILMGEI
uniref:HAP1 N-terminal domain-containing protein n=1 Tax=Megaselia scalaris TaxID=36166 RepID=T1GSA9_MEGSC